MNRRRVTPLLSVVFLALGVAACSSGSGSGSGGGTTASTSGSLTARAKAAFPNGITVLDGSAAGGSSDIQERLIINDLQPILKVPITVQYQTGGGGLQASTSVYHATPSSGTVELVNSPQPALTQSFLNPSLKANGYTPVARVYGDDPVVLLAKKGSKWTSLAALKAASAAGKTITVGATASVSGTRLAVAFLALTEHLKVSIIPFSTGTTAADAAIGGSVDLAVTLIPQAIQLDKGGKTQAVLQFGPKADPSLPGTKSAGELGLTQDEVVQDSGFIGPPHMPADQVKVLQDGLQQEAKSASFLQSIKTQGLVSSWQPAPGWGKEINSFSASISAREAAIKPYMR